MQEPCQEWAKRLNRSKKLLGRRVPKNAKTHQWASMDRTEGVASLFSLVENSSHLGRFETGVDSDNHSQLG